MNAKISNYITALENYMMIENWHTEQSVTGQNLSVQLWGIRLPFPMQLNLAENVMLNFISRVRLAVAKKDETIRKLKSQYKSALERCSYLEELLEQQRREFILK
jgi:hypothetical protein